MHVIIIKIYKDNFPSFLENRNSLCKYLLCNIYYVNNIS